MILNVLGEKDAKLIDELFEKQSGDETLSVDDLISLSNIDLRLTPQNYEQEMDNFELFLRRFIGERVPLEHRFFLGIKSAECSKSSKETMRHIGKYLPNSVETGGPLAIIAHLKKFKTQQEAIRLVHYLKVAKELKDQSFVVPEYPGYEPN